MAAELKDQRVVTMMAPTELQAIDDWMFAKRIRSRGEAIRRLCMIAVAYDEVSDDALGSLATGLREVGALVDKLADQVDDNYNVADILLPLLTPTVHAHDNLLRAAAGLSSVAHQHEVLSGAGELKEAIRQAADAKARGAALRAEIESEIETSEGS